MGKVQLPSSWDFLERESEAKELTEIYVFASCAHPNKSTSLYRLASLQRVSFSPFTYEDVSAPGRSLIGVTMPRPRRRNCGERFTSSNAVPGSCLSLGEFQPCK